MEKVTVKNWVSDHLGELIAAITLGVTQLLSYARLRFQHSANGQRLSKLEKAFDKHTESAELHRNPDFERRLEEIRKQIVQINIKLDRLIERRN